MSLMTASHTPPLTASLDTTVFEACELMIKRGLGAMAVFNLDGSLAGIFTERDLLRKVVPRRLNCETTTLRQVMTSPCVVIHTNHTIHDAISEMVANKVNHLILLDENDKFVSIVSYRTLLGHEIENLHMEVDHLTAYIGSDGIGGD